MSQPIQSSPMVSASAGLPGVSMAGERGRPGELAIVDGLCPRLAGLTEAMATDRMAFGATADPLAAITATLEARRAAGRPVRTLHLVAHGRPGALRLGGSWLDADALLAGAALLGRWRLERIALWSCAVGRDGRFLDLLSELSGAEPWASEAPLGNRSGWDLRPHGVGRRSAAITAEVCPCPSPFDPQLRRRWPHSLGIVIEKLTNGEETPNLSPGDPITWTYDVYLDAPLPTSGKNARYILRVKSGNQSEALSITDDNGTPNISGDDFNPRFVQEFQGDGDIFLEFGETWRYQATGVAGSTSYINVARVVAPLNKRDGNSDNYNSVGTVFRDTDSSGYLEVDPAIQLVKSGLFDAGADALATPGDLITYTYTVTNEGDVALSAVAIEDFLSGLSAITGPNGDDNNNDSLDLDETWIYTATYPIDQQDIDNGAVTNVARVEAQSPGGQVSSGDVVLVSFSDSQLQPGIALSKEARGGSWNDDGDGIAEVGETISFDYEVTNTGNVSLGALELTDDNGTPGIPGDDVVISLDKSTIAPGEKAAGSIDYVLTQADINRGFYTNIARVLGSSPGNVDDLTADATETVDLQDRFGIGIQKSGVFDAGSDGLADPGEEITYTFLVSNEGLLDLTGVVVSDPLIPAGGITRGSDSIGNGDDVLNPNEVWTYTATYAVSQADIDAGGRPNTATVTAQEPAGSTVSDSAPALVPLPRLKSIDLEKDGRFQDENADGDPDVGETIAYSFTVINDGNVTLQNVALTDPLFAAFTRQDDIIGNDDDVLDVGEQWLYTASYTLGQADIDRGSVANTARVTAENTFGTIILNDEDSHLEVLPTSARLDLSKDGVFDPGGDGVATPGDEIAYSFTLANAGDVTLTNVTLTDDLLPAGAITRLPDITGDNDDLLEVGEVWAYSATYAITADDITEGTVTNTATADSDQSPQDSDGAIVDLGDPPDPLIALEKSGVFDPGGNGTADPGDLIAYTFTLTNPGNVPLSGVTVVDPLPGLSTITFISGDTNNDDQLDTTETWIYQATYAITAEDIIAGAVANTAEADSTQSIPDRDSETVDLRPFENAELTLVKSGVFDPGDDAIATPGDVITYSFTLSNDGDLDLTNVDLNDPLLGTAISREDDIQGNDDDVLEVDEVWAYSATYQITQDDIDQGFVSNTATATSDESSPDVDSAVVDLTPFEVPALLLVKDGVFDPGGDGLATPGDLITYTYTVSNEGDVGLTNVSLTDILPGLSAITGPDGDVNDDDILDVDEIWTYAASYAITQADIDLGLVLNIAIADSDQSSPDLAVDLVTLTQFTDPSIKINKSGFFLPGENGSADPGDEIRYLFTVTNPGNVSLTDVTVSDPLAGLSPITFLGGDLDDDDELDVNEAWLYSASYDITQADIDAGFVTNVATADSAESIADKDGALVDLSAFQRPAIKIEKSGRFDPGEDGIASPGELIRYRFTVTNPGNIHLTDVTVTDPLPGLSPIEFVDGDDDDDGELDIDETWTYRASYAVSEADIAAGFVVNTATADSAESLPDKDRLTVEVGPVAAELDARRFFDATTGFHLVSTSPQEFENLRQSGSWVDEGVAWTFLGGVDPSGPLRDVYRIYNPFANDHFLSTNEAEIEQAVAGGYRNEGIVGLAYDREIEGLATTPIFRFYNGIDHISSDFPGEWASLLAAGYVSEGILGWV